MHFCFRNKNIPLFWRKRSTQKSLRPPSIDTLFPLLFVMFDECGTCIVPELAFELTDVTACPLKPLASGDDGSTLKDLLIHDWTLLIVTYSKTYKNILRYKSELFDNLKKEKEALKGCLDKKMFTLKYNADWCKHQRDKEPSLAASFYRSEFFLQVYFH